MASCLTVERRTGAASKLLFEFREITLGGVEAFTIRSRVVEAGAVDGDVQ